MESEFGRFLDHWLAERRWSQWRLAHQCGVSQGLISKWVHADAERRSVPSPRNLERLAPVLGVPYEDLMRLCGYLPGASVENHQTDPAEQAIADTTAEMRELLRGVPRIYWSTIVKAFRRGVDAARDMAEMVADLATEPRPVSDPSETEVRTSRESAKSAETPGGPPLAHLHQLVATTLGIS